jgi:hypothetical protein
MLGWIGIVRWRCKPKSASISLTCPSALVSLLPIEMHDGGCGESIWGKVNAAVEIMGCQAGENEPGVG